MVGDVEEKVDFQDVDSSQSLKKVTNKKWYKT